MNLHPKMVAWLKNELTNGCFQVNNPSEQKILDDTLAALELNQEEKPDPIIGFQLELIEEDGCLYNDRPSFEVLTYRMMQAEVHDAVASHAGHLIRICPIRKSDVQKPVIIRHEDDEIRAVLENLQEQVNQMRGMFDDEDEAIARAMYDADMALHGESDEVFHGEDP